MSLITAEELVRGLIIGTFGGAAGLCTIAFPGSALWLVPAGMAVGGCAFTVPEIRQEAMRGLAALPAPLQPAQLPATLRALPAQAAGLVKGARDAQAARDAARAGHAAPAPAQAAPQVEGGPLRPRQWLEAVNDRPDDNPHLTVVGPSGSGKTTFVSAALGQRPGRVVVLTPKVSPGAWRGAEVVTLDDDLSYAPLAGALDALQTEAKQRSAMLRRGEPLEPLTVVLDELPELHAEIPGAGKFAVRLSRWGRELGIRQVVIATSDAALNIPGWAATRSNYARVELGKPTDDGTRPAILDDGQSRRPIDLADLKADAQAAQLRPWRGEPAPTATAHNRPVGPIDQPRPGLADYPRRDSGSCVNDAIAQLIGREPGIPSWSNSNDNPEIARQFGLEYFEGADAWRALADGKPAAICYVTDPVREEAHMEYAADPARHLYEQGSPRLVGVMRKAKPAAASDELLDALLATMTPERAARLRNAIPSHQDAEGMGVTPIPGNGSNAGGESHSSLTIEPGNRHVIVNATLIAPGPATKDREARTAYEQALEALYRAAGAEGLTFANVYKLHKGTKEIVFPAWQEGRDGRKVANG